MKKRILSAFLAFTMTLTPMLGASADAAGDETEQNPALSGWAKNITSSEPLFLMDFENLSMSSSTDSGFDNKVDNFYVDDDEDEIHGKYITVGGTRVMTKSFPDALSSGRYLLTFDFKRSETENYFYMRTDLSGDKNSNGNVQETFGASGNKVGHLQSWAVQGNKTFKAGEWVNIAMYIDLDKSQYKLYVNNEYSSKGGFKSPAYGVFFIPQGTSSLTTSIDNVAMYKFDASLADEMTQKGILYPDEFAGAVGISVSSQFDGNIFAKTDEVILSVEQKNLFTEPVEYDVVYSVKNFRGDEVWRDEKKDVTVNRARALSIV